MYSTPWISDSSLSIYSFPSFPAAFIPPPVFSPTPHHQHRKPRASLLQTPPRWHLNSLHTRNYSPLIPKKPNHHPLSFINEKNHHFLCHTVGNPAPSFLPLLFTRTHYASSFLSINKKKTPTKYRISFKIAQRARVSASAGNDATFCARAHGMLINMNLHARSGWACYFASFGGWKKIIFFTHNN